MKITDLLNKADSLKAELDKLRPITEDRMNRIMQKLRLDWDYHSNSIEGNTLSLSETRALIYFGITANGKPIRDHLEMKGHHKALLKLEEIVHKDVKITENLVKEFHKIILVEPYDGESEINPGEYKTIGNYLYTPEGERLDFEPPEVVPEKMNELINWLNNQLEKPKRKRKKYDLHPLMVACVFHLRFIRLHPFGDGNGRMARILMNLILMQQGYMPAIVRLEKRTEYYRALNQSTIEDPSPIIFHISEELISSMELALKGAKGESVDDSDDLDKKIQLFKRQISKEPDLKEFASKSSIQKVLLNSIFPLYKDLQSKLYEFKDLFASTDESLNYSINQASTHPRLPNNFFENEAEKWLSQILQSDDDGLITDFDYMCDFHGLKYGRQQINIYTRIKVDFEEYKYYLEYTNRQDKKAKIDKLYHEVLNGDEKATIISEVVERVMDQIAKSQGIENNY